MTERASKPPKLLATEDLWAIWLGLFIVGAALAAFWSGGSLKPWAVVPGAWSSLDELRADLAKHGLGLLSVFLFFGVAFALPTRVMGRALKPFLAGYTVLFAGALAVSYLAGWSVMKKLDLGAPLLALLIGLAIGNLKAAPEWLKAALRTEFYIKTGIVLLGATLPLTLIAEAGPIAFLQATIVSLTTWFTIYFAATRLFKLDPRFAAVLGTGGAVCGVSGSIAIGGAVKADKDHIAIGIAVVSVWAIIMVFVLAFLTKAMIPPLGVAPQGLTQISPAEAGAWVGTSEYADAAGFAVVAELAQQYGDAPIHAFTLMKVIGRDMWIGIWAFALSLVSALYWEKKQNGPTGRVGAAVVWQRFPKFVLGFLAASAIMSLAAAREPADHVGRASVAGVFKSGAQKQKYAADFSSYRAPPELADRFAFDPAKKTITFQRQMSLDELKLLSAGADEQQTWALKELHFRANWFDSVLGTQAIEPIKQLRSWAFVLCFLCIGLSTRFRELATFGLKPFWAFTVGVVVNVPLGFFLITEVFESFWRGLE